MAVSALDALNTLKASLLNGGLETPAEGFKTTRQWANEAGESLANVERLLKHGLTQGLIEEAEYRVIVGKIARKVAHYRFKAAEPVRNSRNAKTK